MVSVHLSSIFPTVIMEKREAAKKIFATIALFLLLVSQPGVSSLWSLVPAVAEESSSSEQSMSSEAQAPAPAIEPPIFDESPAVLMAPIMPSSSVESVPNVQASIEEDQSSSVTNQPQASPVAEQVVTSGMQAFSAGGSAFTWQIICGESGSNRNIACNEAGSHCWSDTYYFWRKFLLKEIGYFYRDNHGNRVKVPFATGQNICRDGTSAVSGGGTVPAGITVLGTYTSWKINDYTHLYTLYSDTHSAIVCPRGGNRTDYYWDDGGNPGTHNDGRLIFNYSPAPAQCADGIDNDNDGATDTADFSCSSTTDTDETNPKAQCQDGSDNDGDGVVDGQDPGCSGNQDNDEHNICPAATQTSTCHCATNADCTAPDTCQSGICRPVTYQCNDGIDNDNDGATDFPNDFSCSSATDNDETNPKAQCQDGVDNDQDGKTDAQDPGCSDAQDNDEWNASSSSSSSSVPGTTQCSDGIDNDQDGKIDALVELSPTNGQTRVWNADTVGIRAFYNQKAAERGYTQISTNWNGQGMVSNDATTADKICELAGFNTVVSRNCFEYGTSGRCNFSSCGDNSMGVWSTSANNMNIVGACGYTWLASLTCRDRLAACSDGIDNDSDGATDMNDFSCSSPTDTDETNPKAQCQDGVDNDQDGKTDYPNDPGCSSKQDNDEYNTNPYCANNTSMTAPEMASAITAGAVTATFTQQGGQEIIHINNTTGCRAPVVLASYKVFIAPTNPGWLDTQEFIAESAVTNIQPTGTTDISVAVASCKSQVDLWYQFAPHQLQDSDPYHNPNQLPYVMFAAMSSGGLCPVTTAQCSDGIDNDQDGATDWPWDFSCSSIDDNDETFPKAECQDGIDNDQDGKTDYQQDPDCGGNQQGTEGTPLLTCPGGSNKLTILSGTDTLLNNGQPSAITWSNHALWNASIPGASWLWSSFYVTDPTVQQDNLLAKSFQIPGPVTATKLTVAADNQFRAAINGHLFNGNYHEGTFQKEISYTNSTYFQQGANILSFDVRNLGVAGSTAQTNPAGLLYRLEVCYQPTPPPQCSDGIDNDNDGATDMNDFSCSSPTDNDETNPKAQCQDGVDNDQDGLADYPMDPGCSGNQDNDERNICPAATQTSTCRCATNADCTSPDTCQNGYCRPVTYQCNDGIDNDQDGKTDYPNDPDCVSPSDNDETGSIGSCNGQPISLTSLPNLQSIILHEDTTNIATYTFAKNDPKLIQDLNQSPTSYDFSTNADEYYDLYISNADGSVNPNGSYLTIDDFRNNTLLNAQVGHNIDAVELKLSSGPSFYADKVVKVAIGTGLSGDYLNQNGYATRALGTPNAQSTRLGDQHARLVLGFCDALQNLPACSDGIDNDGDGATDYPGDFSCDSPTDNDETNPKAQCQDGIDNDQDGLIDYPNDLGCSSAQDQTEANTDICSADGDISMKIYLTHVSNEGAGNTQPKIYLTNESLPVNPGQTIDLVQNGVPVIDAIEQLNIPGLSVQRGNGWVRIGLYGSHPTHESIERMIGEMVLLGAQVTAFENDTRASNPVERPRNNIHRGIPTEDEVYPNVGTNNTAFFLTVDTANDVFTIRYAPVLCPAPQADLSVTKSGPSSVVAGNTVSYTVTAANAGPHTATNVVIADVIPAGLTFDAGASTPGCILNGAGTSVLCNNFSLTAGQTRTFTIAFTVPSTHPCDGTNMITNQATVSSSQGDPNAGNNTSTTVTTPVQCPAAPKADLSIVKTGPSSVLRGEAIVYTVTVTNAGPTDAQNVGITDLIPTGLTFDAGASTPGCVLNGGGTRVLCNNFTLQPAQSRTFTIAFTTASSLSCGSTIRNTADVASSQGDPNSVNNHSETVSTVTCPTADVTITKSGPVSVHRGGNILYTITVTNLGPNRSDNVVVVDRPESMAGLTFNAAQTDPDCVLNGVEVLCNNISLLPGQSRTYNIVFTVSQTFACGGTIANRANVNVSTPDPHGDNNWSERIVTSVTCAQCNDGIDNDQDGATDYPADFSCTDPNDNDETNPKAQCQDGIDNDQDGTVDFPTDVGCTSAQDNDESNPLLTPDLSITKSGPTIADRGNAVSYTVTVTNIGAATALNVVVADVVPTGLTFHGGLSSTDCLLNGAGTSVLCNNFSLAPGQTKTFTITFNIPTSVSCGSTIQNTATVSTSNDPNGVNNTSQTVQTTVQCPVSNADLGISKSANLTSVMTGDPVTYTLTVTNSGPGTASNVVIGDALPAGVAFDVLFTQTSGFSCYRQPSDANHLVCVRSSMAAGETVTIRYQARVLQQGTCSPRSLTNTSNVTALSSTDQNSGNNYATATVQLTCPALTADLSVQKSVSPASVLQGQPLTYTLFVQNFGPGTAQNVLISDALPVGLPFNVQFLQSDGFSCWRQGSDPNHLVCSRPSMAPGETATIRFTATVSGGSCMPQTLLNTASVTATSTSDPNSGNNYSQASAQLTCEDPTFSIAKTDNHTTAMPGDVLTYILTVSNTSSVNATDVTVTDALPSSVTFLSASDSGQLSGGTVTWSHLSIPAHTTKTLSVSVQVQYGTSNGTILTNTANVAGVSAQDQTTVQVQDTADLSTTKTGPQLAQRGSTIFYTVTGFNAGPGASQNATVTDVVPTGLVFLPQQS